MSEVKAETLTDVSKIYEALTMSAAELNELLEGLAAYEYQGFDPLWLYNFLAKKATSAKGLAEDLKLVVAVGIVRGTKLSKAILKMDPVAAGRVKAIIARYDIRDTKPTLKTEVTAARILALCPHFVAQVLTGEGAQKYITGAPLPKPYTCLSFPGAGAIIPKTNPDARKMWRKWCELFAVIVKAPKSDTDFQKIVEESPLVSERQREALMALLKIPAAQPKGGDWDPEAFNEVLVAKGISTI